MGANLTQAFCFFQTSDPETPRFIRKLAFLQTLDEPKSNNVWNNKGQSNKTTEPLKLYTSCNKMFKWSKIHVTDICKRECKLVLYWTEDQGCFGFSGHVRIAPFASWNVAQPFYSDCLCCASESCLHDFKRIVRSESHFCILILNKNSRIIALFSFHVN